MFNYAVAGSLMGQACVVYLPFLQRVFQTEALGFWDLIKMTGIASSVFWADEGRKFIVARRRRAGFPGGGYSGRV
jgi:Ca2+-transporting ATPase